MKKRKSRICPNCKGQPGTAFGCIVCHDTGFLSPANMRERKSGPLDRRTLRVVLKVVADTSLEGRGNYLWSLTEITKQLRRLFDESKPPEGL